MKIKDMVAHYKAGLQYASKRYGVASQEACKKYEAGLRKACRKFPQLYRSKK